MAGRFFDNVMPDFVKEKESVSGGDTLRNLLAMPYSSLSQQLKRSALDLKETVVIETWGFSGQTVEDFTLYSGTLGAAFLLFRAYQVTGNSNDLSLCLEIVKACDTASASSGDVTFLCGRAGVCGLGAVSAKLSGEEDLLNYYLGQFRLIRLSSDLPNELLYGRVGYLWACLFINKYIGKETSSSDTIRQVAQEIIKEGRSMAKKGSSPLMFEWYGKRYWGAAHGLAGIMHVLMDVQLKPDEAEDVKGTLKYMIKNRFPSGNYPASEEDRKKDVLVHWCHGAPGIALTLVKAAEVFGEREFLEAGAAAAEVVWNRGLLKRVGICHGISGNAYVFLALYRATGRSEYLYRAKAFASFLLDRGPKLLSKGEMHGGDSPYSLFEGVAGMAYLFLDMVDPSQARFPGYEL
ncbi:LanC-like protein GCL2 [Arabidopsis thaliana]|uniref:GCL2 n=2 Tax=Arabidopsis TaxID=3701 RepID=A0A178W183_ARATH|nr:Lanthionine synthetase C-like [Arabidopsis thaliana x Arabidopsis arenosa]OAP11083.1 GCL2 [Arabidopsis thaliana]